MVSENRSWCSDSFSIFLYLLNKRSCMAKKAPVTSPIEDSYKASLPSKFRNWQRLFTRSKITISDTFVSTAGLLAHNSSINSAFTKSWILDSGATNHFASDSQFFTHTSSSFIPNVNLPTVLTAPISSTGTIKFNDNIILKDVLCVPSFNLNLMSVSKITSSLNCCVVFTRFADLITNHNNCSICLKATQIRLPFPLSTIKSHFPFNLLHCDIWGPHKTLTHFGKRFFFSL